MSLRWALILAAVLFLLTLLVRLPARLLLSYLPPDVICDDPGGTVWHGSCGQVRSEGLSIAGVSWIVHPAALLSLKLSADLSSADPNAGGSASIEATRNGDVSISALRATLPLAAGSLFLPAGSSATLVLALPSASIHHEHLVAAQGTVDLQQLHLAKPVADLGSYELQFAPSSSESIIGGQLRDLEGPLAVNGMLRLQPNGAYDIDGTVAARSSASDDLNKALQLFLGPPDAQGQHTFSLAGTL